MDEIAWTAIVGVSALAGVLFRSVVGELRVLRGGNQPKALPRGIGLMGVSRVRAYWDLRDEMGEKLRETQREAMKESSDARREAWKEASENRREIYRVSSEMSDRLAGRSSDMNRQLVDLRSELSRVSERVARLEGRMEVRGR